jgi:integrase
MAPLVTPSVAPKDPIAAKSGTFTACAKKIDYCTRNQLRHSYTSIMSSKSAPLEEIADAMGNVDTRMTSLVYRHRLNSVVDSTAGTMEELFGSGCLDT